jgi:hypothetical protein
MKQDTPLEDMQRRLRSWQAKRQYMIADGADPRVIPAKHVQKLVWLAQRLGQKTSREGYSTATSRKAVVDFYLGGKRPELSAALQCGIDREIDRVDVERLPDTAFQAWDTTCRCASFVSSRDAALRDSHDC